MVEGGDTDGLDLTGLDLTGLGLLAGAANVVMQLSHPAVGHGVLESTVESGQLFRHPLKRARTTLSYLSVALLGDATDRRAYGAAVGRSHAAVRSTPSSPVPYDAFDRRLQLWVAACLYVGIEDFHVRTHGALSAGDADRLYRRAATLGTTLQVRAADWPVDRASFGRYWRDGLAAVRIDPPVRRYLDGVVGLGMLPRPVPDVLGPPHRFVTTGFLPPECREQMQYRWTAADQRRFDALAAPLFTAGRLLPSPVRRFPFNALLWDVRRRRRRGLPLV